MPAITLMSQLEWKGEVEKSREPRQLESVTEALRKVYTTHFIHDRFDALCSLIDTCTKTEDDSKIYTTDREICTQLKAQATQLAMGIVDAADETSFKIKRDERNLNKSKNHSYMPWHHLPTQASTDSKSTSEADSQQLLSLTEHGKQYEGSKKYLEKGDLERHRIIPSGGHFKKLNDDPFGSLRLTLTEFDTSTYYAYDDTEDRALLVISPQGDIFVKSTEFGYIHTDHSTISAGGPVFFAGTVKITNGQLMRVDDDSGDYHPKTEDSLRMLAFFRECNLLTNNIKLNIYEQRDRDYTIKPGAIPYIASDGRSFKLTEHKLLGELKAICDNEKYNQSLRDIGKVIFLEAAAQRTLPSATIEAITQAIIVIKGPDLSVKDSTKSYNDEITKLAESAEKVDKKSWPKLKAALLFLVGAALITASILLAFPSGGTSLLGVLLSFKVLVIANSLLSIATASAASAVSAVGVSLSIHNLFKSSDLKKATSKLAVEAKKSNNPSDDQEITPRKRSDSKNK